MPKPSGNARLNINLQADHGQYIKMLDATRALLAEMDVPPERVSVVDNSEGVRASVAVTATQSTISEILSRALLVARENDLLVDEICIADIPEPEQHPF